MPERAAAAGSEHLRELARRGIIHRVSADQTMLRESFGLGEARRAGREKGDGGGGGGLGRQLPRSPRVAAARFVPSCLRAAQMLPEYGRSMSLSAR